MKNDKQTVIPAKAFLSCKTVEILKLPDTVEVVEDWAFAHAKNLRELWLPAKELRIGRKVFLGCDSLERIVFTNRKEGEIYEGISLFLGCVARLFPEDLSSKLFERLREAGDPALQWDWIAAYDEALETFINRPDEEGFVPAFIGWFDVEDVDDQKQGFIRRHCMDKLFVAFQRLLYEAGLTEQTKHSLEQYLSARDEILIDLFTEDSHYRDDIRFYKKWKASGGLNGESAGLLMDRQAEKGLETDPEIKGFLIECRMEGKNVEEDFFADFDL